MLILSVTSSLRVVRSHSRTWQRSPHLDCRGVSNAEGKRENVGKPSTGFEVFCQMSCKLFSLILHWPKQVMWLLWFSRKWKVHPTRGMKRGHESIWWKVLIIATATCSDPYLSPKESPTWSSRACLPLEIWRCHTLLRLLAGRWPRLWPSEVCTGDFKSVTSGGEERLHGIHSEKANDGLASRGRPGGEALRTDGIVCSCCGSPHHTPACEPTKPRSLADLEILFAV